MRQQGQRKPPRGDGRAGPADDWRRDLRDAILSRVVPRLAEPPAHEGGVGDGDVQRFADLALAGSLAQLAEAVGVRRAAGAAIEPLLLDLLAPAARRLGDLWLLDRISFVDVTAALGRLQALVRELGPALDEGACPADRGRRLLLAPAPGEQHVFGLSIVAAFFRRAGWEVALEPRIAFADLVELVGVERFTAVGLTAAGDGFLAALPGQVEALRRASLNRSLAVLVGGPAVLADPDLGPRIGADAAPRDAAEAVRAAERFAAGAFARPLRR